MILKFTVVSLIIFQSNFIIFCANVKNNFILDFFEHKSTPSVVGFSCNNEQEDFELVKSFNDVGVTVSLKKLNDDHQINRFAFTPYNRLGVFLDLDCYTFDTIYSMFSMAAEYRLYDVYHNWLVIGSSVEQIISTLNDDTFNLSMDFAIAVPFFQEMTYEPVGFKLYDIYNAWKSRGANLTVTFLGSWTEMQGLRVLLTSSKYDRRKNMNGLVMKTWFQYSHYRPSDMKIDDYLQTYSLTRRDALSKFGFSITHIVADIFNFTLKTEMSPDWSKGDVIGPVVRAVYSKEIDFTGSPALITAKRFHMVKFVHQSLPFRTCFMFRTPQLKDIKVNEVLGPFNIDVWYLMMAFLILNTWIVAFLFRKEDVNNAFMHYSNSFLISIGAISQQSTNIKINRMSTRMAFFSIMLSSLVIYNYYSCSVVSTRLNEQIYKLNDSLIALAQSNLKVSSEPMQYFDFLIKKSDMETQNFYNNVWVNIPPEQQFMDPEKAIHLVQRGGWAYHTHPEVGYPLIDRYYNNREICELTEIHLSRPTYASFAVDYNSTFLEMVKIGLMKISEVGVRHRLVKRWTSRKPKCFTNILSASSITINEFAPHLIILGFGMFLAGLIFMVEKIIRNPKKTKKYFKRIYTLFIVILL